MKKGFTLIELLVVVLIIGILSAIALPQYTKAVEKSRVAGVLTVMGSLRQATELYLLENGYPSSGIQELIGQGGPVNVLDIDVENVFDCSIASGNACKNQYFAFDADCQPTYCRIMAYRCYKSDCSDMYQNYFIYTNNNHTNHTWTTTCHGYNAEGTKICNSLSL